MRESANLLKVTLWTRVGLYYTHSLGGDVSPAGDCDLFPQTPHLTFHFLSQPTEQKQAVKEILSLVTIPYSLKHACRDRQISKAQGKQNKKNC